MKCAAGLSTAALAVEGDWGQVGKAFGKSGSEMPGGVYRIGLPRTDLKVVLDGVELKPALALGSWLAFRAAASLTGSPRPRTCI